MSNERISRRPWSEPMPWHFDRDLLYLLLPVAGLVLAWMITVAVLLGV